MATPIELQWRGTSAPRAKRISPQEWDQHRAEITQLYQSMTLRCLMETMKNKYGFTPSRRQYVFQFEKWDLQKPGRNQSSATLADRAGHSQSPNIITPGASTTYTTYNNTTTTTTTTTTTSPPTASEPTPTPHHFQHFLDEEGPDKRPRSIQSSTGSTSTAGPTKKKQRDGDRQWDDGDASIKYHSPDRSQFGTHSPPLPTDDSSQSRRPSIVPKPDPDSHYARLSAGRSTSSSSSKSVKGDQDVTGGLPPVAEHTEETFTFAEFGRLSLDVPSIARDIARPFDTNRLIEDYTEEDIRNIIQVAQFLDAFQLNDAVFSLYTIVIKWHVARCHNPAQDRKTFWSTLIYGRNVYLETHCEIIRSLLNQVSAESSFEDEETGVRYSRLAALEMFLIDMTIAMTTIRSHGLDFETTKENRHMNRARQRGKATDFFAQLPNSDRTLDLLTYHLVWVCELDWSTWYAFAFPSSAVEQARDDVILHRIPGPFELKDGIMGVPCLRSCLEWCTIELEDMSSSARDGGKVGNGAFPSSGEKSLFLFATLWERLVALDFKPDNAMTQSWITDTETRMGISPTELLISVCTMIGKDSNSALSALSGSSKRVKNMYKSSKKLTEKDDYSLGRVFLREFAYRRSSGLLFTNQAFQQKGIKEAAFEIVERTFKLKIPETNKPVKEKSRKSQDKKPTEMPPPMSRPATSAPRFSAEILNKNDAPAVENKRNSFHPTLASSLASSNSSFDLSSMRRMRDHIRKTGMRPQPAGQGLPSSAIRDSMTSDVSILAMSELSDVRSTLSSIDSSSSYHLQSEATATPEADPDRR
ncbi:hypothetical protein EJ05DRAFT_286002 [Pseudovirgaria hyperparasitica]|uniref:Clr5 domain-containing protein n=1 Tax=Pseudovirgaria hyperparasitica TaxID=470096 RepID=A0A6A6WEL5_9PEZI|nr:uncharacterized protein EJ05DRAFT_286002 [Pseudovirgaria hyperparasitica]KAF2760474.1 hypothetical protein EJ05DRAFT_286002 [Pseudovirgaria hyperparasitica]